MVRNDDVTRKNTRHLYVDGGKFTFLGSEARKIPPFFLFLFFSSSPLTRNGENVHKFRSFRVPAGLRVVWAESAVLGVSRRNELNARRNVYSRLSFSSLSLHSVPRKGMKFLRPFRESDRIVVVVTDTYGAAVKVTGTDRPRTSEAAE